MGRLPWESEDPDIPWSPEFKVAEPNWRGDQHLEDWPQHLAGPEYWLYRKELGE